ncbi:MAG: LysR family transcriptional regulator [Clostridia bacterium]|nr:LysR family transcriptional regulator [Clostridia bacterium]
MQVSKYEAFIKTVELKSLTKAAEALGYTQSGVTHMLNALESELGLTLLQRGRAGAGPTSDGAEMLPYMQAVCDHERRLRIKAAELKGLESGTLRVGTFTSISVQWFPGILRAFRQAYPAVRVEMWNDDDAAVERLLMQGTIDCAFVEIPTQNPFSIEWLARDPIYAIVPEGHPLCAQEAVDKADLERYPFIWESDESANAESWSRRFAPKKRPEMSTTDDYAIMAMVECGLGVSVLPELVMARSGRRIVKKPLEPHAYRDLGIAVNLGQPPSAAARAFMEHARRFVQSEGDVPEADGPSNA